MMRILIIILIIVSVFYFLSNDGSEKPVAKVQEQEKKKQEQEKKKQEQEKKKQEQEKKKQEQEKKKQEQEKKKQEQEKKKQEQNLMSENWVSLKLAVSSGGYHSYEVFKKPITEKQYGISNSNNSLSDITLVDADTFCLNTMKGHLITELVFKKAMELSLLDSPSQGITRETIVPYDDEDDSIYVKKDGAIGVPDTKHILYSWKKRKYTTAPNFFHSKSTTFRCMRIKSTFEN